MPASQCGSPVQLVPAKFVLLLVVCFLQGAGEGVHKVIRVRSSSAGSGYSRSPSSSAAGKGATPLEHERAVVLYVHDAADAVV